MTAIYFDEQELAKGNYLEVANTVRTRDGIRFEIGEWLARGGNGAIYQCRNLFTGEEFAIKFLINRGYTNAKRFVRESRLMRTLEHDHVVSLVGDGSISVTYPKNKHALPFIIMEKADNNLADVVRYKRPPVSPEAYIGQFRGLVRGLAEMHRHAVHRDIKPENILVFGDRWVLGDYGLCRFTSGKHEDLSGDRLVQGPRYWLSPEVQNKRIGNDDEIVPASDVYQLASVFWLVATGRHPSGVLTREDWKGPAWLFYPIHLALQHNSANRPSDGQAFAAAIDAAALEPV